MRNSMHELINGVNEPVGIRVIRVIGGLIRVHWLIKIIEVIIASRVIWVA